MSSSSWPRRWARPCSARRCTRPASSLPRIPSTRGCWRPRPRRSTPRSAPSDVCSRSGDTRSWCTRTRRARPLPDDGRAAPRLARRIAGSDAPIRLVSGWSAIRRPRSPRSSRWCAARVDAAEVAVAVAAADAKRRQEIDALEETAQSRYASAPMDPMAAAHALVRSLPPNTTVIDEAITTGFYVRGFHHWTEPGHYYFCKGGGLGWGMPAALGVSLARDREPVLCVVGDGSAMYSPQALWTAAHEQLPVVFAVVNNRQYLILKGYLRGMGRDSVKADRMVAMDLDQPPVDFVGLARVDGRRRDARREGRRRRRRRVVSTRVGTPAPARAAHRRTVTDGHASPSICAASASCTTASSPSTTSTGRCRRGERWVVLGPNGSGKTTLVRIVVAVPAPVARRRECARRSRSDGSTSASCAPRIGLASPSFADLLRRDLERVDVVMTAKQRGARAVVAHLHRRRPRPGPRAARPRSGVGDLAERTSARSRRGERQRVQLARTLMADPDCSSSTSRPPASTSAAAKTWSRRLGDLAADPTTPADRARHPPRRRDPARVHPRAPVAARPRSERRADRRGAHVVVAVRVLRHAARPRQARRPLERRRPPG